MKDLQNRIEELKAGRTLVQLKKEDKKSYYKVQSLSSKLSELKAQENGQYITKEDLVEYKGLVIWLMKNKTNYRGYLNLKSAMTILLSDIESQNIVYKTKRGIKGIVSKMAISAGLTDVENNLRNANGIEITDNTYGNRILEDFTTFKLTALMQ
jgi:hypothetical protein